MPWEIAVETLEAVEGINSVKTAEGCNNRAILFWDIWDKVETGIVMGCSKGTT